MTMINWLRSIKFGTGQKHYADPYRNIKVDPLDKQIFGPSLSMIILNLGYFFSAVFVIFAMSASWHGAGKIDVVGVLFLLIAAFMLQWTTRVFPRVVIFTKEGIRLFFWLRMQKLILWPAIESMKIFSTRRSTITYVKTSEEKFFIPIYFGGVENSRQFVKLIIDKASLKVVKSSSLRNAYYERK